jgi:hypothetical protein
MERRRVHRFDPRHESPCSFVAGVFFFGQMMKTHLNFSARDMADIYVPVPIVQSEHNEFIKPEHAKYRRSEYSRSGIDPPPWREPSRTAAKAGAIQQRDAGFPRQGSFLEEIDTPRRLACPHWIDIGFFMDQWDGNSSGVSRDIQVVFPLPVLPVTRILR